VLRVALQDAWHSGQDARAPLLKKALLQLLPHSKFKIQNLTFPLFSSAFLRDLCDLAVNTSSK
jgi:hypothetical protein